MKKLLIALLAVSFYTATALFAQKEDSQTSKKQVENNQTNKNGKDFYYGCFSSAGIADQTLYVEYNSKEECQANCRGFCKKINEDKNKFDAYEDTAFVR